MDFRTCPACKASVLEDDVDDCPFCGASMSGKPSQAPPKGAPVKEAAAGKSAASPSRSGTSSPAAPRPGGTQGAAARPASRPIAKEQPQAESDDPFEVDTTAARKAAPVSPRPAKGRMHRIVCPMCETPGFIAVQQGGTDVKCCNPDCLVPIFKAPAAPKAEKPAEPEPRGMSLGLLGAIGAAMIVVGGALWFFVIRPDDKPVVDVAPQPDTPTGGEPRPQGLDTVLERNQTKAVELTPAIVRTLALAALAKVPDERDNNRSIEFSLRLSAEAYADAGQVKESNDKLARLKALARRADVRFYQIEPLVIQANHQLAANNRAAAEQTLATAAAIQDIPTVGRAQLDAVGALAAALVRIDRLEDAKRIALAHNSQVHGGRLSTLWRSALDRHTYDIDAEAGRVFLKDMPHDQWATVTRVLTAQGEFDKALTWAAAGPDAPVRDHCLGVWAAGLFEAQLAGTAPADATARIETQAAAATPAGQARIWSAVADIQQAAGKRGEAETSLAKAIAALSGLPPTQPLALPDLKAIYERGETAFAGLPDPGPLRSASLAASDVADVAMRLDQRETAWTWIQWGVATARATAPGPVATAALVADGERNRSSIEQQLKTAYKLTDATARNAFGQYRRGCANLQELSTSRFALQRSLLRRGIESGLAAEVWPYLVELHAAPDVSLREEYLATDLSGLTGLWARWQKDEAVSQAVARDLGAVKIQYNQSDVLRYAAVETWSRDNQWPRLAGALKSYYADAARKGYDRYAADLAVLRLTNRLLADGKLQEAYTFSDGVGESLIREDALWLVGATAARTGDAVSLWKLIDPKRLPPTEKAAVYRGLVDGLSAPPPAAAPAAAAPPAVPAAASATP